MYAQCLSVSSYLSLFSASFPWYGLDACLGDNYTVAWCLCLVLSDSLSTDWICSETPPSTCYQQLPPLGGGWVLVFLAQSVKVMP